MHGTSILQDNMVTGVSSFGFWILISNKEYFISFKDYPQFKKSSVENLFKFKMLSPKQLYWKDLDIDIELDALEKPSSFPLIFK